jgi:YD repeat-containing protein
MINTRYTYDILGRLVTAVAADGQNLTLTYDAAGNPVSMVYQGAPGRAAPAVAPPPRRPLSAPTQVGMLPQVTPQAPGRPRVGRLTVRSGELASREFLIGEALELGREPDNDAMLPDPKVSRHHARIRRDGERYVLADLGSSNGTFVNGERVNAPASLEDGDVILLGDVELVFSLSA